MKTKYIPHLNINVYEITKPEEAPWVWEGAHYEDTTACCTCNGDIYGTPEATLTDFAHEVGHRKLNHQYNGYARTGIAAEIDADEWALKKYRNKQWFDTVQAEKRLMRLWALLDLVPDDLVVFDWYPWFMTYWGIIKNCEAPEEIHSIMRERVDSWSVALTATGSSRYVKSG